MYIQLKIKCSTAEPRRVAPSGSQQNPDISKQLPARHLSCQMDTEHTVVPISLWVNAEPTHQTTNAITIVLDVDIVEPLQCE